MMSKYSKMLLLLCSLLPSFGFRGTGSAKMLEGKTESVIFFISDPNTEWTQEEKKDMVQLIYDAENWLIKEASKNGKELNFSHHFFGWEEDITVPAIQDGIRSGYEDVTLAKKITGILGYDSPQQVLEQFPADNTQLLFVLKKDGASYAFAYDDGMADQYYVEGMAIYHRFAPDTPNCAACVAHEMLHLFGAHDYYKTFQTTAEQEAEARQKYPDSIMLRTSYDITELEIDQITKWRIGWSEDKPSQADFFNPVPYPQKPVDSLEEEKVLGTILEGSEGGFLLGTQEQSGVIGLEVKKNSSSDEKEANED